LNNSRSSSYGNLIRTNPNFRKLWYGQIVSLLGDWFSFVASATLVAGLTKSGLAIGFLIAIRMLPPFLVSPVAGVAADRFNRKYLLIVSDILRGLVVLCLLFVHEASDVWVIYLVTGIQMLMTGFFFPARNAILPDLVGSEFVGTANALTATTWSVMLAMGAALGGVFSGFFGVYAAFLVDSATYFVSAIILAFIMYKPIPHETALSLKNAVEDYLAGLNYLKNHRDTFYVTLQKLSFALFMGGAMEVVQVTLSKTTYSMGLGGSTALGLMYAVTGLGTGVGPIFVRRFTGDHLKMVRSALSLGFVITIVGLLIMAPLPMFTLYLMGGFLRGFGGGINWVFSTHLLMATVPAGKRGRVFSMDFAFFTLAHAMSTLLAGWLMDSFNLSPGQLIFLMAGTLWLPGLFLAHKTKKHPS